MKRHGYTDSEPTPCLKMRRERRRIVSSGWIVLGEYTRTYADGTSATRVTGYSWVDGVQREDDLDLRSLDKMYPYTVVISRPPEGPVEDK